MMRTKVASGLRAAVAQINVWGWGQDAYMGTDGCLCAGGAINMSLFGTPGITRLDPLVWDLRDAFADAVHAMSVAYFNDVPGRQRHEVTDGFMLAAWLADNDPESRWAA